jgi:peptidoglycan/LPS O-acetylase OafA/YrhL
LRERVGEGSRADASLREEFLHRAAPGRRRHGLRAQHAAAACIGAEGFQRRSRELKQRLSSALDPGTAMNAKAKRIPSLDGWRAISITLVLVGHLLGTRGFLPVSKLPWLGDLGHLGVTIFFVISGFLITSLLIAERERTGRVSLKAFYLRRVIRIFPAFYAFVALICVADALGWLRITGSDIAAAVTYTVNYYSGRSWPIGHLWSLSIEEQFYLLWPFVFVRLREKHALAVALAAWLAAPVVRAAMHVAFGAGSPYRDLEIFPAAADAIAIGCAMALLRPWLLAQGWYLRLTSSSAFFPVLVIGILMLEYLGRGYTLADLLGTPPMLIALAIGIEATTRHADSLVGRMLNLRPLVFLGVLSYSLYLWQQPFLNRQSDAMANAFPQNLGFALLAALLSYLLVEKPLIGFRRRLERVEVPPPSEAPTHPRAVEGL